MKLVGIKSKQTLYKYLAIQGRRNCKECGVVFWDRDQKMGNAFCSKHNRVKEKGFPQPYCGFLKCKNNNEYKESQFAVQLCDKFGQTMKTLAIPEELEPNIPTIEKIEKELIINTEHRAEDGAPVIIEYLVMDKLIV